MITRRFIYALLRRVVDSLSPARWIPMAQKVMRYITSIQVNYFVDCFKEKLHYCCS